VEPVDVLIVLAVPVLCVAFWLWITLRSFRSPSRSRRRAAAALSALCSADGALLVWALPFGDDYNDFPGYTCVERDDPASPKSSGALQSAIPAERRQWDPGSNYDFPPNIRWHHEIEWWPVGMRCVYVTRDEPTITVVTHSSWWYTPFVYGLGLLAAVQTVRIAVPTRLGGSGRRETGQLPSV